MEKEGGEEVFTEGCLAARHGERALNPWYFSLLLWMHLPPIPTVSSPGQIDAVGNLSRHHPICQSRQHISLPKQDLAILRAEHGPCHNLRSNGLGLVHDERQGVQERMS